MPLKMSMRCTSLIPKEPKAAGEDCIRILNGQLSSMTMAMSGRLQITGDIGLAMQLKSLFPNIMEA
jgi:putative sterol carrier protein